MRNLILATLLVGLPASFVGDVAAAPASARVRDLTIHEGDIPRRLVGYGLVVGLKGTGDRSFGGISSHNPTVSSVVNLLRRFDVEVPAEYLRLRNVAAVLVTAEVSPYLRAGGRFEVQVSALGDATSLEGGNLWIAPMVTDPNEPPLGTAQGTIMVAGAEQERSPYVRQANSGRIPDGGILEVDPLPIFNEATRLLLRRPDRVAAKQIADSINQTYGDSTASVEDPGSILLQFSDGNVGDLLAEIDMLSVDVEGPSRVVIHGMTGSVVAGGEVHLGSAVIHHNGITLQIGGAETADGAAPPPVVPGLVQVAPQALVQDVAGALHAAGARPGEIASIFDALRDAGALRAEVVVR